MKKYYVCGVGYDEKHCQIPDEWNFGAFDTYDEAFECFVKVQCRDSASFFTDGHSYVYVMKLAIQECEQSDYIIGNVILREAFWIYNPNFNQKRSVNRLEIKLSNGHKIVAKLHEYADVIPPEIALDIEDENGIPLQDIAIVRAKEKEGFVVDNVDVSAEVLVWADKTNEDYTHQFLIDECDCEDE